MLISVIDKKKCKKILTVILVLAVLAGIYTYFNRISYPLIVEISEVQAENYVNNIINQAIKRILELRSFYEDFYTYEKNNDGEVVLIKANTASINQLMAFAQIEIQDALNDLKDMQIDLHVGAFLGSSVLADRGPVLKINIMPIGNAVTQWDSFYYNKGINQTIHRLLLRVAAKVNLVIPLKAKDCIIMTDIIIAEDIIVGRVPDTYIGGMQTDDLSNSIFDILSLNN